MAERRMLSFLSPTSCRTASMTFGPPILARASEARDRTHQSPSSRAVSRYLMVPGSAISFSTSTAERRANSDSSFSTLTRCFMVSGCRSLTTRSTARACTSSSGSASSEQISPMSRSPGMAASASSAALRTILFLSFSCRSSARATSGWLKRLSSSMMFRRTDGSLPSTRAIRSGHQVGAGDVPDDLEDGRLFAGLQIVGALE